MDPDRLEELARAVQVQEAARTSAEQQINALVLSAVRDFSDWYSTLAITSWARALVRRVQPVQRSLARSTDAYLASVASVTTGRRVRPVGSVDVSTLRSGVTHEGAYGRVAESYRYQEYALQRSSSPVDLVTPDEAATKRALDVAGTDAMLVPRAQSQKFMTRSPRITGYRRIIHPELSKTGTCGLCVAASDRLYGPTELMPIHPPTCHCVPLPVYDGKDPGSILNRRDLDRLYRDAGDSTSGDALRRTRYQVNDNGELGPVLAEKGYEDPQSGRRERERPTGSTPVELTPERAQVVLEGQKKALTKAQELADADPQKWGQYLSQVQARIADLEKTAES